MTQSRFLLTFFACFVVAALLRLIWPQDIEFKWDEAWTFQQVIAWKETGWSHLGMPSSKNILNPGLSAWVFQLLGIVFSVETPADLARAIVLCNLASLVLLALFTYRYIPPSEQIIWLGVLALIAVNPMTVLMHRKIWPPCVLPMLLIFQLIAWANRGHPVGAWIWGFFSMIIGQIHMAGFIFAIAFAGWHLIWDRKSTRWLYWGAGVLVGLIPMIPWLQYVFSASEKTPSNSFNWHRIFEFKFWLQSVASTLGFGLKSQFGNDWAIFQKHPGYWAGHGCIGLALILLLVAYIQQLKRQANPITEKLLLAAFVSYGLLFTSLGLPFFRHYLLTAYPLATLWLAWVFLRQLNTYSRLGFIILLLGQFILTVSMLQIIHERKGLTWEYGPAFSHPENPFTVAWQEGKLKQELIEYQIRQQKALKLSSSPDEKPQAP